MPSTRSTWSFLKTGRHKSILERVSRGVRGASFSAFCGVFRPQGRLCRTQSPWHGRSAQPVPSGDEIPMIGFLSHDAAFHEETVKIGFVSLLGHSRFLHATLFYVTTSIRRILALFGHFFTFITLAPKKLIRTRRASEGSASEPSLARRVSMCKDAKLSCRGNRAPPVKRRGFQICGSCRVGRLSPLARHPNCQRGG